MDVKARFCRVSVASSIAAVMLLAVTVWAGAASDDAKAGAFCARPVMVSRLPRNAVLDTTWYRLGSALAGCRIVNRENRWAIEDGWCAIRGQPDRFYRVPELFDLNQRGVISDSTRILSVRYRFMVKAGSATEAQTVARAKLPARPPRAVRKELGRLEREYQEKLKAQGP